MHLINSFPPAVLPNHFPMDPNRPRDERFLRPDQKFGLPPKSSEVRYFTAVLCPGLGVARANSDSHQ